MKQILFVMLLLAASLDICAQKITYEKSFEAAKEKSRTENKPLFILITMTPPPGVTNYLSGFNTPEVAQKFKESFVSFHAAREDNSIADPILQKYKVSTFPAFIFIDSHGGLLFKEFGNSILSSKYLDMAERAIAKSREKSLVTFDNEYALGHNDVDFLRKYIDKRKAAGITNNAKLIEEYVGMLTVNELEDYEQVLFILEAGPTADSKAYKLAYTNKKIVDSIYKNLPFEKRTKINNTIIGNTMAEAIASKSVEKAMTAANFTRSTWGKDYVQGQKNYTLKLLQYYQAIKDTTNYLRNAAYFYDLYYMNISADSIKRSEEQAKENAKNAAMKQMQSTAPGQDGVIRSFSLSFASNTVAVELNNAAYSFYQTGTRNSNQLMKAMLWSRRSIKLEPEAGFYDTLAHLLYRLGFFSEAESTQEKAVELARKTNQNVRILQEELQKIRKKEL